MGTRQIYMALIMYLEPACFCFVLFPLQPGFKLCVSYVEILKCIYLFISFSSLIFLDAVIFHILKYPYLKIPDTVIKLHL